MEEKRMEYILRLRLKKQEIFFGPGVYELLCLVDETGSLQTAAGRMSMSYSKAWKVVRTAESELGFSLMERHAGGAGGGSSNLTEQGKIFVLRYGRFQQEVGEAAEKLFRKYFTDGGCGEKD